MAFEGIVHEQSNAVRMKNTKFIKGRHSSELDKTTLMFIKDIARPQHSFEEVLKVMNSNYRIGVDKSHDFQMNMDGLKYDKESSELILPYVN